MDVVEYIDDISDDTDSSDGEQSVAAYDFNDNKGVQSAPKRRKVEVTADQRDSDVQPALTRRKFARDSDASDEEIDIAATADQSDSDDEEFDVGVVFALDVSTSVSDEECKEEVKFVKCLTESWNCSTSAENRMGVGLVVYGEDAKAIPYPDGDDLFPVELHELKTKWCQSKNRRMDLALTKAAEYFSSSPMQHQLVVLITTGRQLSDAKNIEDNRDLLVSASKELSSRNIKVIIVPVGMETDFKELGLIVKRPQSLLPLTGFQDMTHAEVQNIVTMIKQTSDIAKYVKKKMATFTGEPLEKSGLWENSSLCCDVLEGAWYCLYDDKKEPKRTEIVRKFIRESIDSFHSVLVTESKICISLVVFGPLGAGKSFFLNFLLNWGLDDEQKVKEGPLPSADGGSQTPFPVYLKYGKKVQVLYRQKREDRQNGVSPEIWFAEKELSNDTLTKVKNALVRKFQDVKTGCVELQGPFPVFRHLKERAMTSTGHLELEVDVEFVDVPGCGDKSGNDSIGNELRNADVVLFFGWGKSNRPVSSEDIAQVFRRCEELEFTSRPKLVHVINDRTESLSESWNLEDKKKELKEAWDCFLDSSSLEDEAKTQCYRDVREKLPQLSGEALLDKLSSESEVIYFHSKNDGVVDSLKKVISDHVQSVKIKQMVHPYLQNVHCAAKKLKTRIGSNITTEKRKQKTTEVKEGQAVFKIVANSDDASDLVTSFLKKTKLPLHLDIKGIHRFLYDEFMYSSTTLTFLKDILKQSLGEFTSSLIYAFMNANWTTVQVVPTDLLEVVEILCESRVEQFCANSAPAYLLSVVEKMGNRNPFGQREKKKWSNASPFEKKNLCSAFLYILLNRTEESLEKETRDKYKKSHFHLIKQLNQDVKDLFAVRSLDDDASKTNLLTLLFKKLQVVIQYCNNRIREINPHPCLDVEADTIPDPEKMENAHEDETIPLLSTHDEIIKEAKKTLLKPGVEDGADAIRKLESKLNYGKGGLELRQSQSVDQCLWAKVLINVLSDKDHFNIQHEPSFVLDDDAEVNNLVKLAQKRLFAHQKSCVTCNIVHDPSLSDNEIYLKKSTQEKNCLKVLISPKMADKLDAIREEFKDPSRNLAPIFIPTIRPGPTPGIRGNYFLEENPWDKGLLIEDRLEDEREKVGGSLKEGHTLNIFLVVEQHHLKTFQTTIETLWRPTANSVNLMYIVLPQKGRGIGVTRAIIKSVAECLKFSLYWTIDDDIQFMYQFDGNGRRWHKCSITRGLLFGQRVFQACMAKTVRKLSDEERGDLYEDVTSAESGWPSWAIKAKRTARNLLINEKPFSEVQKNPSLLHLPFAKPSEDCGEDADKEKEFKLCEQTFVEKCRKRLFEKTVNHIAGVSLAHESSKKYDYMSKYPKADYMCSEQRYQVVLHNAAALKGMNYVTDEMIFLDEEFQIYDQDKRNTPYWGIRGSDKSFCRALKVSGVIGYQVIRIVHSHKKLTNVFNRISPSYIASQSPYRSEDEDEDISMDDKK